MNGITILNEIVTVVEPMPMGVWLTMLFGTIAYTGLIVIGIIIGIKEKDSASIGVSVLFGILVFFLWVLVCATYSDTQREPRTTIQYEVIISDEVAFKDFTEKYQIIEQRNDIYVIQEINNDKQ